jgi:hypothetical protein
MSKDGLPTRLKGDGSGLNRAVVILKFISVLAPLTALIFLLLGWSDMESGLNRGWFVAMGIWALSAIASSILERKLNARKQSAKQK